MAIFLVLAIAIALYARHVSGGWMRPWISIKPVWWFLLLLASIHRWGLGSGLKMRVGA